MIIFFVAKEGEALCIKQKQDWELTIAQIISYLLKIQAQIEESGETTKPFRYNLNQIPYDYTVKVTNRFKGLNLIDRVPEELWKEVCNII